ncbi:NDxxF motif lipoprotein [Alkalicoccobacillus plakortidis]|uniref:NDxxF motif lipoprotein n=1 Tax=Alkalicoccobacillus plakortidis TaxID=444060 RepID=A0ABT0XKG5_9BACI|nr:NDxxF motif lipoprotein [Alkalicoccobacillus plakortidis]MCM2676376.1 NDxxF motif lipoprotein [Alkalicoccobacillus plakortidis]
MKKGLLGVFGLVVLAGCNQAETEVVESTEIIDIEDIEIFAESDQTNESITEEEIKDSLKTYLDSSGDLHRARFIYEVVLDSEEELDENEAEAYKKINLLLLENDLNFSAYISANTLPDGYQDESEHISDYITTLNQYLIEFDDTIYELIDGEITIDNLKELGSTPDIVNGKEQAKIEKFLEEKEIESSVFE